jgi:hypothetical protein
MMLLAVISWWYSAGWANLARRIGNRVSGVMEAFSVSLLLKTLFSPFRQIDAGGSSRKALDAQLKALGDQLFSRLFGAFIRTLFIIIGTVIAGLVGIMGVVQLLIWPLVPFLPVVGVIAALVGYVL